MRKDLRRWKNPHWLCWRTSSSSFLDVSLQESIFCRGANPPNISARAANLSPQLTATFVPLQSLPGSTPRGQRSAEFSLGLGVSTPTTSRYRAILTRDERLINLQGGRDKRGLHLVHIVAARGYRLEVGSYCCRYFLSKMRVCRPSSPIYRQLLTVPHRAVASEPAEQLDMGYHSIVGRNGEERRIRVGNLVPYQFPVSLPRENKVDAFHIPHPVEGMRDAVLRDTKEGVHQGKVMVGSERSVNAHRYHCACLDRSYRALHNVYSRAPPSSPSRACIGIHQYKQLFMLGHLFYGPVKCCPE